MLFLRLHCSSYLMSHLVIFELWDDQGELEM